ncbi:MAG: dTDP-4-amino-4,6-dideoxygalactose transaminase [Verrucomicrobiales bacterium]
MEAVPFNIPHFTGREFLYVREALANGHVSGNGPFTRRCHEAFKERYGFQYCLLTSSCTDGLEMCALLLELQPGDEVIVPSYTFVSTANAFAMHGAKIVFADSCEEHPNIDPESIAESITPRTRAIVVVHYGGVACDMDAIQELADKHGIIVIEDAAQAIDATYKGKPLGSIGHLAAFSFHETKNLSSGEGGLLVVNDPRFARRAEILWEKGTNRAAFRRGEVDKYCWVDTGSSFLPSDITAAMLCAQLESVAEVTQTRTAIFQRYEDELRRFTNTRAFDLPSLPSYPFTGNGHLFYVMCCTREERNNLLDSMIEQEVYAVFHYLALHQSPYYKQLIGNDALIPTLPNAEKFAARLVRLPVYSSLTAKAQQRVIEIFLQHVKSPSHSAYRQ